MLANFVLRLFWTRERETFEPNRDGEGDRSRTVAMVEEPPSAYCERTQVSKEEDDAGPGGGAPRRAASRAKGVIVAVVDVVVPPDPPLQPSAQPMVLRVKETVCVSSCPNKTCSVDAEALNVVRPLAHMDAPRLAFRSE